MQVVKVTVNDETLIVRSEDADRATHALAGSGAHDAEVSIEHVEMSQQDFDAIPEYQ